MTDRLIRSYHRAFSGELILYTFSKNSDIRPPRPIHARWLGWVVAIEIPTLIFTNLAGFSLQFLSMPWFFVYVIFPVFVGWVLKQAKVEGRLFHEMVLAWVSHFFGGHHLAGGYRRLGVFRPVKKTKIRVRSTTLQPSPSRARYTLAAFPTVVILAIFLVFFGSGGSHHQVLHVVRSTPPVNTITRAVVPPVHAAVATPVAVVRPHGAPTPPRSSPTVINVARQFANAYLSYQIGQDSPAVQAQFHATCMPQFAALLSGSPVGGSYKPFHVVAVSYKPPQMVIVRFANRQRQHGTLHVHVQTVAGGWRVAGLS